DELVGLARETQGLIEILALRGKEPGAVVVAARILGRELARARVGVQRPIDLAPLLRGDPEPQLRARVLGIQPQRRGEGVGGLGGLTAPEGHLAYHRAPLRLAWA